MQPLPQHSLGARCLSLQRHHTAPLQPPLPSPNISSGLGSGPHTPYSLFLYFHTLRLPCGRCMYPSIPGGQPVETPSGPLLAVTLDRFPPIPKRVMRQAWQVWSHGCILAQEHGLKQEHLPARGG